MTSIAAALFQREASQAFATAAIAKFSADDAPEDVKLVKKGLGL